MAGFRLWMEDRMHISQRVGAGNLGSATEQWIPAGSSPRGSAGVYVGPVPGRAPYPEGSLDLGHQRNVGFVSSAL